MEGAMASLRLGKELETRLDHLAELTGRTKTFYIRMLLEEHIDELEDRYIAEQRLETPAKRLSSQQMRQELGLEH
jgi:RHH-type transcriptional regulator, rel operon repressor / antitoxin RelB